MRSAASAAPCVRACSVSINAWSISIGLTRASSKWIMHIHFELVRVKSMEIDLHWFNTHELKMDMFWICLICRYHGGNILCQVINSWPISALGFIHEGYNWIYGLRGSFHCAIFWGAQGAAPKKIAQWKEPKAHRFNWCLEKRNGIFVLYPSSIYGIFQLLSPFMSSIFI